jgi:hypothetical protein
MDKQLLFRQEPDFDYAPLLRMWPRHVTGRVRPLGVSVFGDVFLERADGAIHELDVLDCCVRVAAPSRSEFRRLLRSTAWRADHLMADLAAVLYERNIRAGPGTCIGFAPHPRLSGSIEFDSALIMELASWHTVCSALA